MTWTLVEVVNGEWILKSDGIPYEDEWLSKQFMERYGYAPSTISQYDTAWQSSPDDWMMKSRQIIGFTEDDIKKAIERGYTIVEPDEPVGKAWMNSLTNEQRTQYMVWVNKEKAFQKALNEKIDAMDQLWKEALNRNAANPFLDEGKYFRFNKTTGKYEAQWGEFLMERTNVINEEIKAFREANPGPDFRAAQEKIASNIKKTANDAWEHWVPNFKTLLPKAMSAMSWISMAEDWLAFIIELSVFAMFIYEESLQVASRWVLNAMWPKIDYAALYGILYGEFQWQFNSAVNCYLSYWFTLLYTESGYRAYLNAASITQDCAMMILGHQPLNIQFE